MSIDDAIHAVGCVLLDACSNEKRLLRPWKPFDVNQVAKKCIEAYEAATQPERESSPQWQPIETAPKDGTRVLLYVEQIYLGKNRHETFFITDAYCDDDGDWITKWGGDTVESVAYNIEDFKVNPIHWMPLRKPPTTRAED